MTLFVPGSTPWLILHELRLAFRGRDKGRMRVWMFLGILSLPAFGAGISLALVFRNTHIPIVPEAVLALDGVLLFVFSLMLSVTVSRAAQVFFERGDLDLLLSSPIPGRRVLTARCVGMALSASLLFLFLVTPFVVTSAILDRPERLWVYGLLISMSLLATALGLTAAMALFAVIGPRAAKTLSQVLATMIGAAFYLFTYGGRLMGGGYSGQDTSAWTDRYRALARTGWFDPDQPASWPLRALAGEPIPATSILVGSLAVFLLVTAALGGRFERDAAAAAGVGAGGRKKASARIKGFSGGAFQAMLRKEILLMRRDIALISQVLLRVLYLIPTVFVLWKSNLVGGGAAIPYVVGVITFLSGQIASSLGWIAMSGEEGLELLATAPAQARILRRAKLVAVLIPLFWVLAIPIGLIAWQSPQGALAAALGSLACATSAGLIAIWYEKPAPRSQFRRRRSGSIVGAIADLILGVLWASAAGFGAGEWWPFAAAPVILAVVGLLAIQRPQLDFSETLQAK